LSAATEAALHSLMARSRAARRGRGDCGLNESRAGIDGAEGKKRQLIAAARQMFVFSTGVYCAW
jgi:hypothetical protein